MAIETTRGLLQPASQPSEQLQISVAAAAGEDERQNIPEEAGQRTGSGPAVVVELSAAARETARAVNAAGQTADQERSRAAQVTTAMSAETENRTRPEQAINGREQLRRAPIDVVV